jgi:phosphoserine/homoserine phosphotransferase
MSENAPMNIICSDMEGIFTPEIWINVAKKTGIDDLKLTTRDVPDYDVLMKHRLSILNRHGIRLKDIQNVISGMDPLPGAKAFLDWMRAVFQVIVVSDTYVEFAGPLLEKLGRPTLFCHCLTVNGDGMIVHYNLRQPEAKKETVLSLKRLNYRVIGIGDSYNDIRMLQNADHAVLFHPPENVKNEFPEFPVTQNYDELKQIILSLTDGECGKAGK